MGRYATYRRRGTTAPGAGGLAPPPAPFLSLPEADVVQDTSIEDNTGGQVTLYGAEALGGPWSLVGQDSWDVVKHWGEPSEWENRYLRATQTGNGTHYIGESQPSNVLEIHPP